MKLIRNLCTGLALTACAVAPTLATAEEAPVQVEQVQITLHDQVDMIRADVAEGVLSCSDLMTRINNMLAQIDTNLDNGTGDKLELLKLRNVVLSTRSLVKCTAHAEHSANGTELTGSCPSCNGASVVSNGGGSGILGSGPLSSGSLFSGGGFTSGGGGGFAGSAAGGAGGGLGIGALGAIGAAIAIPVAASSDDDAPGPVASPSIGNAGNAN